MTPWIVDASVTLNWYLADEADRQYSISIFQSISKRQICVPSLWPYEIANVLLVAHRRGRIPVDRIEQVLEAIAEFEPQIVQFGFDAAKRLGKLALQHQLTVYDAAYLDLALRTGFPIATQDKALVTAMKATHVAHVIPSITPAN